MTDRTPFELVSVDVTRALDDALAATDGAGVACAWYTTDEFNVVYVGDELLELYDDTDENRSIVCET